MVYDIYENGEKINSIIADEDFVTEYCKANGYTFKLVGEAEPVIPPVKPEDLMLAAIVELDYRLCMQELNIPQKSV